jgi:hypothetical protein
MKTYAEIDLHSSNNYIGIIDAKDPALRDISNCNDKTACIFWGEAFFSWQVYIVMIYTDKSYTEEILNGCEIHAIGVSHAAQHDGL